MKKIFIILFSLSLVIILSSCSKSSEPPVLKVEYNDKSINATVGTNSWNNVQSCYPAPSDLADDEIPIKVKPESKLSLVFKNNPESIEAEINENKKLIPQKIEDYKVTVPKSGSRILYELTGNWKQGTVHYWFVVDVES